MSTPVEPDDREESGGFAPYVGVLLVALVIGIGLVLYVVGYRAEIVAILTQSPT
jgi:hypothetical protein